MVLTVQLLVVQSILTHAFLFVTSLELILLNTIGFLLLPHAFLVQMLH